MYKAFSVRIPVKLEDTIRELAKEEQRSVNNMINLLLQEALEKRGIKIKSKK